MIDVILPALNEEGAIKSVIAQLPPGYRAIVVDNNSTDNTALYAKEAGAEVVFVQTPGYGSAVHTGIEAATSEIIVIMDADATLDPRELPNLVQVFTDQNATLLLGSRSYLNKNWSLHGKVAVWVLAVSLSVLARQHLRDLGPLRIARREDVLALQLTDRRFGYPLEMVLKGVRASWKIVEHPVSYHPRVGKSKVTGTLTGTLRTVWDMLKTMAHYARTTAT